MNEMPDHLQQQLLDVVVVELAWSSVLNKCQAMAVND
jgi:hypothetical protein